MPDPKEPTKFIVRLHMAQNDSSDPDKPIMHWVEEHLIFAGDSCTATAWATRRSKFPELIEMAHSFPHEHRGFVESDT